jgi:hypothetical protein
MYVNGKKIVAPRLLGCFNTEKRRPEALALPYEHIDLYPERKPTNASFSKIINPEKR